MKALKNVKDLHGLYGDQQLKAKTNVLIMQEMRYVGKSKEP